MKGNKGIRKQKKAGIIEGEDGSLSITGRWTRDEHDKFIEGKFTDKLRYHLILSKSILDFIPVIAMHLYGKDWRKVEAFIGSRCGAQIRSHA